MGLYKKGRKWYCSIVNPKGVLIRKPLSEDKHIAEVIFGKMRQQFELQKAGILPEEVLGSGQKPLRVILREFLNIAKMRGRGSDYFERFDSLWRQVVENRGVTDIRDVTLPLILEWVTEKQAEGNKGQSINQAISLLRVFTAWATRQEYLTRDPLVEWVPLKPDEKEYRRDLTAKEVAAILAAEKDGEYRLRWMVYFYTGLRKGAGEALTWEWIDWRERLLTLPIKKNKSRKTHRIPIHPELYSLLQERYQAAGQPTGLVFPKLRSGKALERFQSACRRAGVNLKGVCLHSVRHTVATTIYEATGRNLKAVQEVLGHANVATTAMYLHVNDEVKRNAVDSIRYF